VDKENSHFLCRYIIYQIIFLNILTRRNQNSNEQFLSIFKNSKDHDLNTIIIKGKRSGGVDVLGESPCIAGRCCTRVYSIYILRVIRGYT